jgi:hypothetical protein
MMQQIPADPLAGPVGMATHAPAPLVTAAATKPATMLTSSATPVAALAEPINPATTMMQKIPDDPLAGPVTPHVVATVTPKPKPANTHVAAAVKPKAPITAAAKPADRPQTVLAKAVLPPPPALRTASDTN